MAAHQEKYDYSVWGVPPEDVALRLKKVMEGLRSEFGGPEFEPHVTVVRAISLTEEDALNKFRASCDGVKEYSVSVDKVDTVPSCVYLLLHPSPEVVGASAHCSQHFGYKWSNAYKPHLNLLYADTDLTDDEREKAKNFDESIKSLSFQIGRLQLWKTDPQDKTLKSWEKVVECTLSPN